MTVEEFDYRKLHDLLKAGQWKKADEETFDIILKLTNQDRDDWFKVDATRLKHLPCEDLKIIDQLWVTASQGHFGFSVQKQIWEACGRPASYGKNSNWHQFCYQVGWDLKYGGSKRYCDLEFDPSRAPKGELPRCMRWYYSEEYDDGGYITLGVNGFVAIVERLAKCAID